MNRAGPTLAALLSFALGSCASGRFQEEIRGFHPMDTGSPLPGVMAFRDGYVNWFLVEGPDGLLEIDAGIDPGARSAELLRAGVDPSRIRAILLTHAHKDHFGGLGRDHVDRIRLSSDEAPRLRSVRPDIKPIAFHDADTVLSLAGIDVRIIPAPGHTPGSVAYLVGGSFLFVGDAMAISNGDPAPFNPFFTEDAALADATQARLLQIAPRLLITAHHGILDARDGNPEHPTLAPEESP